MPEDAAVTPADFSDDHDQRPLELDVGQGYTLSGFRVAAGVLPAVRHHHDQ